MAKYIAALKTALFILCLLPLAHYAAGLWQDTLGANPIEALTRGLGDWALRLLLITLAVTPLRRLSGWAWLLKLRRMLGLFAFFYASLHLIAYLWLDQFFDWAEIGRDILKRPFITVGMAAFLMLVPLAATSTAKMIKRLGARRWKRLHQLVYPAAALGCLHYFMMVKADIREPLIYAAILTVLLGWRLATRWRPAVSRPSPSSSSRSSPSPRRSSPSSPG